MKRCHSAGIGAASLARSRLFKRPVVLLHAPKRWTKLPVPRLKSSPFLANLRNEPIWLEHDFPRVQWPRRDEDIRGQFRIQKWWISHWNVGLWYWNVGVCLLKMMNFGGSHHLLHIGGRTGNCNINAKLFLNFRLKMQRLWRIAAKMPMILYWKVAIYCCNSRWIWTGRPT